MALTDAAIILEVRTQVQDTVTPYKTSSTQMSYFIKTAARTITMMAPNAHITEPSANAPAYPTDSTTVNEGLQGAIIEFVMACIATRKGDKVAADGHMAMFKFMVDAFLKSP